MKDLGLNTIRVYEIDPTKNHDACMNAFASAGIYLLLDIATPKHSINRVTPEYDLTLYRSFVAAIDAFAGYSNTLGFVAGNEVSNDKSTSPASAFVKAALRDAKQYIKSNKQRYIPVGYASNDDQYIRDPIKDYFNCGDDMSRADFFGVNLYEWCGNSTFQTSGYSERTKEFQNYSIPVFLSEYGCNVVTPRVFSEVAALYGSDMTGVWSGGVVYEWSQEDNNYGLVKMDASGSVTPLPDYQNLKNQLAKVSPQGVSMDSYNPTNQASQCPAQNANWQASSILPPTPSEGSCKCMMDSLTCVLSKTALDSTNNGTSPLGTQLNAICGTNNCSDISADATKGSYGAFSYCTPEDKLSYMYTVASNGDSSKCSFSGFAMQAQPQNSDISSCSKIKATNPETGISGGRINVNAISEASLNTVNYQLQLISSTVGATFLLYAIQYFM
ncbi:1 3-beta-glucanosyltransferase gel4 [Umbelopsis sp. WA50703]